MNVPITAVVGRAKRPLLAFHIFEPGSENRLKPNTVTEPEVWFDGLIPKLLFDLSVFGRWPSLKLIVQIRHSIQPRSKVVGSKLFRRDPA